MRRDELSLFVLVPQHPSSRFNVCKCISNLHTVLFAYCLQHDKRGPASIATDNGDLQQHHSLRSGMQSIYQSH